MAKVKLNPVIEQVRGGIGDLVFKRYQGEMIVSRKADPSGVPPTEAQLTHRERFRQATVYGKMVLANPRSKALYEQAAAEKGVPLFALVVADFFHTPEIDEIDLSAYSGQAGDAIVVQARDDFAVAQVQVTISDSNGAELEAGAASESPAGSGRWLYNAQTTLAGVSGVRVSVRVSDRPGGVGEETAEKALG